jgi:hypothetical protein
MTHILYIYIYMSITIIIVVGDWTNSVACITAAMSSSL